MNTQNLRLLTSRPALVAHDRRRQPLGQYLVDSGAISSTQLIRALHMQMTLGAPVGEILVSEGWASASDIRDSLAQQHQIREVDLTLAPPDEDLCHRMPHSFWLRQRVIPWKRENGTVLIATDRPDRFDAVRTALGDTYAGTLPILASGAQIEASIAERFMRPMAKAAGARVPAQFSCRTWQSGRCGILPAILLLVAVALVFMPITVLAAVSILAIATLIMFASLKLAAFSAFLFLPSTAITSAEPPFTGRPPARRPKISMLVPLFREKEIAGALIRRLEKLTYPKALLDVVLVLEEHDDVTRQTLAQTRLPAWMRVISVPAHDGLTTKPRAMNYALDFCRGDIIGVWDAEDAPAPDQLETVAARFAEAAEDVVCLQGVLDYYNPRTNWLARCFTIEYASWFRVVLPGIARLGLVIPLGGTTLFFRRDKLEELGGWDAHNVTEDADLGVRLCRAGYRTELIDTVTFEEANCRPWPWIKQRSRWLKGFMVTYLVHMRNPYQLFNDLGLARFLSLQAFFVGTLCQFLLAPVLWSFWLVLLGWQHPVQTLVPASIALVIAGLFVCAELLVLSIGIASVAATERRFLLRWVPTLPLYFPLAAIAAYKALYELIFRPYYWDKTQHGHAPSELNTD